MEARLALCVLALLLSTFCEAQLTVEELQGEYSGPSNFVETLIHTEEGSFIACNRDVVEECREEIPPGVATVVINGSTFSFGSVFREGILTPEDSVAQFPGCAAAGITLSELRAFFPPARIQSYDPVTGHLTFIDSTRPDDINCAIVTLDRTKDVSRLKLKALFSVVTYLTPNATLPEASFRCVTYNHLCSITATTDRVTAFVDLDLNLPYIG